MHQPQEETNHHGLIATAPPTHDNLPRIPLELRINGRKCAIEVEPRRTLAHALRHDCGLTGTKLSCEMGDCGVCTVMVDGRTVYSCLVLAVECDGKNVRTIEDDDELMDELRQAMIDHDGFQCGFCTPGQIMSLRELFERKRAPDEVDIAEAIGGNLCRCGAYRNIIDAALAVSRARSS